MRAHAQGQLVNIVSQIPPEIWDRELPTGLGRRFVHTSEPIQADVHIIYGLRSALGIPNSPRNTIFVASEPPEIRRYNLRVLDHYRYILAPDFGYLRGLPNFREVTAIAPWWVGSNSGGSAHYTPASTRVTLTRSDFQVGLVPTDEKLSIIVSSKARTPVQEQRLRLVDFLASRIPEIEIYGPNFQHLADKADALRKSRYHLSVENSLHPGYWTEKLSDPLLMDNVVFYGGDPNIGQHFDSGSIKTIDPFDMQETYSQVMRGLEGGLWAQSSRAREKNRQLLLDTFSFHRVLSQFLDDFDLTQSGKRYFTVPKHHPKSGIKRVLDPIYRLFN